MPDKDNEIEVNIEDLRARILELEETNEALKGENESLKAENTKSKERIDSLVETNSKLYLKVSTKIEETDTSKKDPFEDILNELKNNIK